MPSRNSHGRSPYASASKCPAVQLLKHGLPSELRRSPCSQMSFHLRSIPVGGPYAPQRCCAGAPRCRGFVVPEHPKPMFFQLDELTFPECGASLLPAIAMLPGCARSVPAVPPAECCTNSSQMICAPPRARCPLHLIREFLEHLFVGPRACVFPIWHTPRTTLAQYHRRSKPGI